MPKNYLDNLYEQSLCHDGKVCFNNGEVRRCYDFARQMIGRHNPDIIMPRSDVEIFRDDFRGKLGEFALERYLKLNLPNARITKDIDMGIYEQGIWDSGDLIVNNLKVDIKSVKGRSNFLMVETERFDDSDNYTYTNNDGTPTKTDLYVLVRVTINPEIQCANQMMYTKMSELKGQYVIYGEILGAVSYENFMLRKHTARRGTPCNKNTLSQICMGQNILPVQLTGKENKTRYLQQDNYILSCEELYPVEKVINKLCTK